MSKPDQPLAPRDLLILVVLAEGASHGYGVIKAVEERSESGVFLDPANLYRVLRRMSAAGWIAEQAQETRANGGGPPRRIYEITDQGRDVLAAEVARLESLLRQARPALAESEP